MLDSAIPLDNVIFNEKAIDQTEKKYEELKKQRETINNAEIDIDMLSKLSDKIKQET
jgi:hypothetical protein